MEATEPIKRKGGRRKKESLVPPYIGLKKKLSPEEKARKIKELQAFIADTTQKMEEVKGADPFWFFEPSTGVIDEDRKVFLRQFLKEEDVPLRLDSQVDAILSDAEIVGIFGGNQAGKSTTVAIRRYIKAIGELPNALKGVYPENRLRKDFSRCYRYRVVGVDFKQMNNTLIPTFKKWAPRDYLKNGKWDESFSVQHQLLSLYKKGVSEPIASIEFMTNQQDAESFQGPPLDGVDYDEEPTEKIYKENMMRFVTAKKVDVTFGMTPTNGISWATNLFDEENAPAGKSIALYKLVSVTNKKANLEAVRVILEGIEDYQEKKMRLLGEVISLSGLVYGKLFDRHIHVIAPFFEDMNAYHKKEYLCLCGLDPHTVTPTAMVFMLLDREENVYIDRCYSREATTDQLKEDYGKIVRDNGYRMGWSVADKSSDSSIIAFGGRNIFRELKSGKNAISALRTSEKYEGSIKAGVDDIKKRLKVNPVSGKPTFFIVDRPENKDLIRSMRTLERDTYADEDKNGPKDRIKEGKHHHHSAMRFLFQYPLRWYPAVDNVPQPSYLDEAVCW